MARLDTGWHANPKVLQSGYTGMGLHAWSISYCDHARSDGFIPMGAWPAMPGAGAAVKAMLVLGLWERVEGGFRLHDYTEYNRSRAEIEELQEAARERQSRHRSRVTNGVTNGEHSRAPATPARTGPGAPGPGPGPGVTLKRDTPYPPTPLPTETAGAQGPSGTAPASVAQTCPMCNRTFIGPYADHRCAISRPPQSLGSILGRHGRKSDISVEELDRVSRELAEYRQSLAATNAEASS